MFTAQGQRLSKRLRPNYRTRELFLSADTSHHITKGLLTIVPFPWHSMSTFQEKIIRHTEKWKTCFEQTEQALEQDPDPAGMSKLSDHEVKTTMINMERACVKVFQRNKTNSLSLFLAISRKRQRQSDSWYEVTHKLWIPKKSQDLPSASWSWRNKPNQTKKKTVV